MATSFKSQLTVKDPDARKDSGQGEKWMAKDEMADSISDSVDMSLSKPLELVMDTEAQRPAGHGVPKSQIGRAHV